ncbi:hypothetical protein GGI04_003772 [Coemansia thaxteri]|uniref:Uncharacterized protein n=1 Tax=Coemansia thaxteri TaxID=2663907 RepID=A0A9W8BFY8_9FUNG|nr:hypothetical protein GGI04_003772 [Coemansia thaxteri]KAJ2005610.1 hypothetical protein H4R26_001857 [Coemansia thaxteri]KAJ2464809.1 hypothetical protein GGI02_004883 [Coemansia sp. RSA 2322]KAJ2484584.1 hypothetical protein EV174_002315 [Coemansia sp. RSA 2320]
MVLLDLQLSAELDGVTELKPVGEDFLWNFKIKCNSCDEVTENFVTIDAEEEVSKSGKPTKSKANFVMRCKFCRREGSIGIEAGPFAYTVESNGQLARVLTMDCRGLEPVEFDPCGRWEAVGTESNTPFAFELEEGMWSDYDEKKDTPVMISEIGHKFVVHAKS